MGLRPKFYSCEELALILGISPCEAHGFALNVGAYLYGRVYDLPLIARRWSVDLQKPTSYGVICASGYIPLNAYQCRYEELEILDRNQLETDNVELYPSDQSFNFEEFNEPIWPWEASRRWAPIGVDQAEDAVGFEVALPGLNAWPLRWDCLCVCPVDVEKITNAANQDRSEFEALRIDVKRLLGDIERRGRPEKIRRTVQAIITAAEQKSGSEITYDSNIPELPGGYQDLLAFLINLVPELMAKKNQNDNTQYIKQRTLKSHLKTSNSVGQEKPICKFHNPPKPFNWDNLFSTEKKIQTDDELEDGFDDI